MKYWIGLLLLANVLGSEASPPDAFDEARKLGRGVNLLSYDRVWESREKGRFKPKHFQLLKEAGFSHVRINLFPFQHMVKTNNWVLEAQWVGTLDWIVNLGLEQKLKVILDMHEFAALGKDPAANKEQFLAFWRQMATHYQNSPKEVWFEILNEPSEKLTEELWNDYFVEALAIIREKHPTRMVIVGPGHWNSIDHLGELILPEQDRNLIVTVHYYQPFEFTHQGASWVNRQDKLGVPWDGTPEQRAAIKRDFDKVSAWAKKNNRPIYLGEFGAYEKADMAARSRYTDAVARAAEAQGWSWAYWEFNSGFAVYDARREKWVEPILRALIPQSIEASKP
jgi:endoglucanase